MKNKILFLFLSFLLSAGCASANDTGVSVVEVDGRTWTVYENFSLAANSSDSLESVSGKTPSFLGTHDGAAVFASSEQNSQRADNVIGFVNDGENTFMLGKNITFRCKKSVPQCVPSGIEAEELAGGIYSVKANSLSEWKSVLSAISSSPDILKYEIIKDFGVKNELD